MKKYICAAAAVIALGACQSTQSLNEGARTNWRCADGKQFSLRRVADGIEVFAAGQTFRLDPAPDVEGHYTNGAVTYSEDGGRASLTGVFGGPYENCRRKRSDWWFDLW